LKILFVYFFLSSFPPAELTALRKLLPLIGNGESYVRAMISESTAPRNQRVARAYKATALMALARYQPMPHQKYRVFRQGRQLLDSCVRADTLDPETRFLRLTVQQNAPVFLNYRRDISLDLALVSASLSNLARRDPELAGMIKNYLGK
jgi:hypothetical protein